jgi:IS30 family transposase
LLLFKQGKSRKGIKKELKELEHQVSDRSIYNIINCKGQNREAVASGLSIPKRKNKRKVRTDALIKKVANEVNKPNPISQNNMVRKFGTKQQIINKIIHEDLGMITRKNARCMISNQNISKIGKLIVASYTKIIWRLTEGAK